MLTSWNLMSYAMVLTVFRILPDSYLVRKGMLVFGSERANDAHILDTPIEMFSLRTIGYFLLGIIYYEMTVVYDIPYGNYVFIVIGFMLYLAVEYIANNIFPQKLWHQENCSKFLGIGIYEMDSLVFSVMIITLLLIQIKNVDGSIRYTLQASVIAGVLITLICMRMGKWHMQDKGDDRR